LSCGNLLFLDPAAVKEDEHPVLAQLSQSFHTFKVRFLLTNNNFWASHLFLNPLIRKMDGNLAVNERWLNGNLPRLTVNDLMGIKISDVLDGWNIKRLDEIVENTNCPLSLLSYMRLAELLNRSKPQFTTQKENDGSSHTIEFFLNRFKKGSRKIRKILRNENSPCLLKLTVVKTYKRLTLVENIDKKWIYALHSLWGNNTFNNGLREFCFKFSNNALGLNTRVSHFNNQRDRICDLCRRGGGGGCRRRDI
jgi:hypothetical protein